MDQGTERISIYALAERLKTVSDGQVVMVKTKEGDVFLMIAHCAGPGSSDSFKQQESILAGEFLNDNSKLHCYDCEKQIRNHSKFGDMIKSALGVLAPYCGQEPIWFIRARNIDSIVIVHDLSVDSDLKATNNAVQTA
jgi:hypothetical protein